MMRLTFTLLVALYAGFVIWGRPADGVADVDDDAPPTRILAAEAADYERPMILADDDASGAVPVTREAPAQIVVPDAATIAASAPDPSDTYDAPAPIGQPVRISLVDDPAVDGVIETSSDRTGNAALSDALTDVAVERMVVTGSRVNLRDGPSTANAVVTSLPGGTEVEALGGSSGNWMELRDPATGATGWMSANFLSPA